MNNAKVLLHLGLPKTATSSLQHNVLQTLHVGGRIKFLGKCLSYDLATKNIDIVNYAGKFIRDAAEGKISIKEARNDLVNILDEDKLNVFSDEGLMVAYPGKENLPLAVKINNLADIFSGYDLQVIVTLRNPVEYLYSLYVELYPDFCSNVRKIDSIEKYGDELISSPDDILFESFFFDRWLVLLKNEFPLSVVSYEKLVAGDEVTMSKWADLLGVDQQCFSDLFNVKKVNVKQKSGKEVHQMKDLRRIEIVLRDAATKVKPIYALLRWVYNASGFKKILNYRVMSKKTHKFPEGVRLERINTVLISSVKSCESI